MKKMEKCKQCNGKGRLYGMLHIPCGGTGVVRKFIKKNKAIENLSVVKKIETEKLALVFDELKYMNWGL